MKVLFDHPTPFALAHGGLQIQIIQTREALQKLGVEVEFLRWWDADQTGDILHYFGRMRADLLRLAQGKGMKVVLADLLTSQGSRPKWRLKAQKTISATVRAWSPDLAARLNWNSYRMADACIALTPWEADLLENLFGAPREKIKVIPNGVEEIFLQRYAADRGQWLVCTATITERKRVVELAEAAVQARTPLWIIGKPYSKDDPYARRLAEIARQNPALLRYEGAIEDRATLARIYREARGFVLLSAMESLSLSALEAAACGCRLLLSDLPWARTTFGNTVAYCPITISNELTARTLKAFYDSAPVLTPPRQPASWHGIATEIKKLYETLLNGSVPRTSVRDLPGVS